MLVVDDDQWLRPVLADKLRLSGFTVAEASNGVEGLELALRQHPDLILLDIVMPKLDGLSVLKQLRQDAWGKTAAVILLSNLNDVQNIAEAAEGEVCDYLIKTHWTLDEVVVKIKERLHIA